MEDTNKQIQSESDIDELEEIPSFEITVEYKYNKKDEYMSRRWLYQPIGGTRSSTTSLQDMIEIKPRWACWAKGYRTIDVKTMHISCQSDTYQDGHEYGGVILYQYNRQSEWTTTNNTRCKTGYIVIQDSGSKNVKQWSGEPGAVHGAVYRNAFGESVSDAKVVGEGFAIRKGGKLEICSGVFNNPSGSVYHDRRREMHELPEHCVRKVVEYWKAAGPDWVRQRTFEIKHLLKDFRRKESFCNIL